MVHREIESNQVPQALKRGIGILPYSPLQRGLLTGKIKPDHQFAHGDTRESSVYYKPENIQRINAMLEKIRPIASDHGATLSQLVINWTANQPAIASVLVGARDDKQVADNAKSLDFKLSDEEMHMINAAINALSLVG
jgi:aryl-alcohol dehydrogenase-like predicted oxidoreductase